MKIVAIFAGKLYTCQYDGVSEYTRLTDSWTDISHLRKFAKENNISNIKRFTEEIIEATEYIQDKLAYIDKSNIPLESFFMPLDNLETRKKVLSLQKGKRYSLRIYAIKIDENLFVITGGAIKLVFKMKDHADTRREKEKLESAQAYFRLKGVFDNDSFYELINEDYED